MWIPSNKNSTVLAQKQTGRPREQNRKSNTSPFSYRHFIFDKEPKICIVEKTASSTNGVGKTGYLPAED
jgi:hypothetical protein